MTFKKGLDESLFDRIRGVRIVTLKHTDTRIHTVHREIRWIGGTLKFTFLIEPLILPHKRTKNIPQKFKNHAVAFGRNLWCRRWNTKPKLCGSTEHLGNRLNFIANSIIKTKTRKNDIEKMVYWNNKRKWIIITAIS